MTVIPTWFFSQILGKSLCATSGKVLGKVQDLVVAMDNARPKVVALVLKQQGEDRTVDFSNCSLEERNGQVAVFCDELKDLELDTALSVNLGQRVLDHHVVDLQARKMVKVIDLKMTTIGDAVVVSAVDVGVGGRLRRLGLDKHGKRVAKFFGKSVPAHLIPWEDVDAIDFGHAPIRVSKNHANLAKLHPADLADILEDLDRPTQMAVFESLNDEQAADVLEEMETDAQVSMIEGLSVEKAADLLEKMPADQVADLLDELHESKAEELLNEMDIESSEDVRELMEYPDNTVGSIMSTDTFCFFENHTVEETIKELRQLKPESDMIYYLYVVDSEERLISTVSLRDIIISEPEVKLNQIMNQNIVYVQDTDRIDKLNEIIAKYSLLAVPVVDVNRKLLGMVVINDVMETLLRARRIRI